MVLTAENISHLTRKTGRSNSPGAVQRRRLQNRLAQRNHRHRVRGENRDAGERSDGSLDKTATSQDTARSCEDTRQNQSVEVISSTTAALTSSQSSSPPLPVSLPSAMMNYPFMSGDPPSHQDDVWPQVDPRSGLIASGNRTMPSPSCGTTCHCHSNHEQIRLRYSEEMAPFSQNQRHHIHQAFNTPHNTPASNSSARMLDPFANLFYTSSDHSTPSGQSMELNDSNEFTSYKTGQQPLSSSVNCQEIASNGSNLASPSEMSVSRGLSSSLSGNLRKSTDFPPKTPTYLLSNPSMIESRHTGSDSSPANLTQRFNIILETMRTAGFQDFESMALAYYTSGFEKNSVPSIVQCSSRSRRVKTLLQQLQESSSEWLRWESRGFHEGLSEATASLCVKEMERLRGLKSSDTIQNQPTNLVTAVEWVLTGQVQSLNNNNNSHKCTAERLSVFDQQEVAPDMIPHLWSLLTELAGVQSMYCDEIARIVLSILIRSRDM